MTAAEVVDRRRRRIRIAVALVVASFVVVILVWVAIAGRVLVRDEQATRTDAVVVLSGDELGDRLLAGGRAFLATDSSRLVMFMSGANPIYASREDATRFLEGIGLDEADLRALPIRTSTADEAALFAAYARECGWSTVMVVTSPYHTGRAGWLFERALGDDVRVITVASDEPYDEAMWWRSASDRESTLLEWVKIASSIPYVFSPPEAGTPDVPC